LDSLQDHFDEDDECVSHNGYASDEEPENTSAPAPGGLFRITYGLVNQCLL
jgi:hypothetical protein